MALVAMMLVVGQVWFARQAEGSGHLVAAYSFDQVSAGAVDDASGRGNTGTVDGATPTSAGKNGGALSFDGSGDVVTVNDSSSLDLTAGMTIEAWVRPTSNKGWTTIAMKERPGGLAYSLYGSDNTNRPPAVYARIGGADRSAVGSTALALNTWTHVAATYNGATLRLYVNGTQVRSQARTGPMATSTSPLRIGGNSVWGEYFTGLIDDVRIYNLALTQSEVKADMGLAVSPPPADSVAPTAPAALVATATSTSRVQLTWDPSTDAVGVTGYRVLRGGTQIGTAPGTGYDDRTVSPGATYSYVVRGVDAAGNVSGDSNVAPVTVPTPETTPPAVAVTSPADGSVVSGNVTVAASASDTSGIAGVQFLVGGAALGAEDTVAPYTALWDASSLAVGDYTLSARARDGAGNLATSTSVTARITGDFSFTVRPRSLTMPGDGDGFYEIEIAYLNGFTSSNIDLTAAGLPAGATGRFLFDPLVHQGTTEFLVTTVGLAEGSYGFTLGATDLDGSGLSKSAPATLIVSDTANFALTATPEIQNVVVGGSADYDVTVTPSGGFSAGVSLAASGLPSGASASFTPPTVTPPATTTMRLTTTAAVTPGQRTVTVTGTSGALSRTVAVTLNVTAASATWAVATMGTTGTPNNTVRVGRIRADAVTRVYVGTIGTGRVLEYSWSGASWGSPVDVGGSPSGQEIHDMTIGPGRGSGQDRLYAASYDRNVYEIWHDGTAWRQLSVATLDGLAMHAAVGDGRGDGQNRLYLVSTKSLYEYTWNGTQWVGGKIADTPGSHGVVVGAPRGGTQRGVYVASISSGSFEARWNGTGWSVASMGDSGDVRNISVGNGRNDGVARLYGALLDGRLREYSWGGTSWTVVNQATVAPGGLAHTYVTSGRNDGVNRVYASSTDGAVYEFTWNGSSFGSPVNMGGGSDYMYGQHFGDGRNDGVTRVYSADRGSVNRVYEFTWTASVADAEPPTAPTGLAGTGGTGTASLAWSAATDNVGVAKYNIHRSSTAGFIPGPANLIGQTTGLSFVANGLSVGTHRFRVTAQDGAGNLGPPSSEATVVVAGDAGNPTVTLTSPAPGVTVSGSVTVAADASDAGGIAGVTFLVDGVAIAAEDTTAPYSVAWNTASGDNTSRTVTARARDNAGNTTISAGVTVTVANTTSSGLIAAYGFNEGSGSVASDKTASHPGTIANAAWAAAGRYGSALAFDGNGDMVTVGDTAALDLTAGMTLSAWVRPNTLTGWTTVVLKERPSGLAYALYASDNTNQPPAGYVQIGGDQAVRGTAALPLATWTHLTATFDGAVLRLYANATLVTSRNLSGSIATSAGPLRIGGNAIWGEYFNGLIDEVRVYNRALTQAQIQTDMATPL